MRPISCVTCGYRPTERRGCHDQVASDRLPRCPHHLPRRQLCAEKQGPFSIEYAYAGLTEITVKDGKAPLHLAYPRAQWVMTLKLWIDPVLKTTTGTRSTSGSPTRRRDCSGIGSPGTRCSSSTRLTRLPRVGIHAARPSKAWPYRCPVGEEAYGVSWAGDSKIPKALAAAENDPQLPYVMRSRRAVHQVGGATLSGTTSPKPSRVDDAGQRRLGGAPKDGHRCWTKCGSSNLPLA